MLGQAHSSWRLRPIMAICDAVRRIARPFSKMQGCHGQETRAHASHVAIIRRIEYELSTNSQGRGPWIREQGFGDHDHLKSICPRIQTRITLAAVTVCMHSGPSSLAGPAYLVEGKSAGSMWLLSRVTYIQSELSCGRARSATVICQRTVDSCQNSTRTGISSHHDL